ncbi:nuclear cap-binding protein subunit 3-like [Gigantopelta aegis]|uniref:nuclear cap-binding protein subunit 3-like n=1 Tax=Gigantopelta aegis TaxID=1735272 RepID=UPI001B88B5C3|nr:nuclear cap-binding protein subunit 3-like [Gigantopelta aegis]
MASHREKLPNLKICLDNTEENNDIDEELSIDDSISDEEDVVVQPKIVADDKTENVEFNVKLTGIQSEVKQKSKFKPEFPKKYENKTGNFVTGIDITSKEAQEKKKERAQRFGLPVTNEEEAKINLTALYTSLGIKEGDLHKDERGIRLEAIHLRGTDNMSTQDVFKYFGDFAPGAVEWIDDSSCNVVWLDTVTAARAMMKLSYGDETANSQLEDRRKSRKHKSSPLSTEEHKPDDVEMEDATTTPKPGVLPKDVDTETKPDEPKTVTEDQQMEVDEEDDELDLCADDEPKPKPKETTEPVVTQEGQNLPPDDSEPKDERSHIKKNQTADDDSDSGVEDNPSDRDDESDDCSDHDDSSYKKTQNDVKSKTDDSATKNSDGEDNGSRTNRSISWPPGRWRLGIECQKARFLFMRFATKADKKIPGAEKKSKYYQKYGNPNYGGMKGLISGTRKRKYRYSRYRDEIDEAHDAVVSHRLSKKNNDDVVKADDAADDEPEEGEIVDSGDEQEAAVSTKISPLNRSADDVKEKDEDDELDMDAELEQLLGSPPKKRTMRMYADDEEEQLKAKRIARSGVFTITADIQDSKSSKQRFGKIKDARELIKQAASRPKFISDSNHLGSNDLRARLLNKRKNRVNYHSESDDDDDNGDDISRTDLRSRLTVTRTRDVESPGSSYSFSAAKHTTKSTWSELSRGDPGRNGRADESGGRTLVKYESDSDDDLRLGAVVRTTSDNSESSSNEQDSRTKKSRTRSSDSSEENNMSESESSSDDNSRVRNSDLRSRLGSRRKPNSDYPSMRIEVLD